uniref:Uncharacterized protein n=1 Tax=Panagrolaimus sp. ES5 TaxID=591445 RepID=A0AC34F3E5_9BILA
MHLFLIIFLIAFLQASLAQQSQCNFQSDRYNLSWSADNYRNVNYNLTYFNFPTNGNYWVALGYSQPVNNLILLDGINGQIEIGTANIVNNQPRKTVNSNILVQKSAFLSNGNLHAQFSIPLDALRLSSNDGSGCLQWQFYTNATRNGTQYNGMPQTSRICDIEKCLQQPTQMMFNDPSFSGTTKDPNEYYEYLKNLYQQQLQQRGDNIQYQRQTTYGNNNNQYQTMQNDNNNYNQNSQNNNQYDQTSNQYQTGTQNYNTQTTSDTYPVQGGTSNCNSCNQQIQPQNTGCITCNQQQTPQYQQQTSQTSNCNSCNQQNVQQNQPSSGCSTCNQQPSQNQQLQQQNSNCNSCNQQNQGSQYQQNQQQYQTSSQYGNNNQGGSNAYGNNVQYNPQSSQYGNNQGNQFQGSTPSPGTGFVYDSPQTNSNSDFVVENPNYIFLNPGLTQEFRDSVNRPNNQNGLFRDQSGNLISTTTQAPLLSNDEQNRQNYQRIQSNPPTTVSPSLYTNNIYGYDYRSNQNQPFTVNGNNQQYQPPPYRRFEAPSNSPFKRRKRQAASGSLAGTAYEGQDRPFLRTNNVFFDSSAQRNPSQTSYNSNINPNFNSVYRNPSTNYNSNTNQYNNPNSNSNPNPNYNNNYNNNNNNQYNYQNVQRDQQPNNASIYWPYRQQVVSADDVVNPNSPNYTQVLQQNDAAERNFENPNCSGQDPYWCQDYVNNFMLWQNQYDGQSQQPSQMSCSALTASLINSASRCCQNVRQVGCNA